MTAYRSVRQLVAGVIVLALLLCVWAIVVDERCSRALDQNDITYEEWGIVAAQSAQSNDGGGK